MPARIESEKVDVAIRLCMHDAAFCFREGPARFEQVERLGEYIVVDEARINREQTHEQYDVSPTNIPSSAELSRGYQKGRCALEERSEDLPRSARAHLRSLKIIHNAEKG
jgi:hypothetical protein